MALTVNFTAEQTPGSPGDILFTDTSSGSDGTITQRRIYIQKASGSYIVRSGTTTQYEVWSGFPGTTTITLEDILDKDYGCRVVVQWLTAGGVVVYDKTKYYGFNCYNEDFDYEKTGDISANAELINDTDFWGNKLKLRNFISSGDKAIQRASDISNCQLCYDKATEIREKAQYLFNANS